LLGTGEGVEKDVGGRWHAADCNVRVARLGVPSRATHFLPDGIPLLTSPILAVDAVSLARILRTPSVGDLPHDCPQFARH
jgi:hypothetical protein